MPEKHAFSHKNGRLSFIEIKKSMDEGHKGTCKSDVGPDVYVKDAYLRDDGRIEVNAECQSCAKSGISVIADSPDFWK